MLLGIKFPFGMGGNANFLINSNQIRGLSLNQIRDHTKTVLSGYHWPKSGRVLIDAWESQVVTSPSLQTWIPPKGHGDPVIEGLFEQAFSGETKAFVGSCLVLLPSALRQQIIDQGYLLTILFQQLGYVGRCSFDLILVGQDIENCRVEFVECNARWGGASIPMTLMNRLHVKPPEKTYCVHKVGVPGLDQIDFGQLVEELAPDLFDAATGKGQFILFNPARLKAHSEIEAIAIGDTKDAVGKSLHQVLPAKLEKIVNQLSPCTYVF